VTLTLDFANAAVWNGSGWTTGQTVQSPNHATNIGLKIGGNLGNAGEVQPGVAFDVDMTSAGALWAIKDAGLQDTTNFVDVGWGSAGSVLNARSDIASNPGTRFNVTLNGSGWQDIMIADNFDKPSPKAGIAAATGNSGDLSGYRGYAMTVHNPGDKGFLAALCLNTGYTDWSEPDRYYQGGDGNAVWVAPGATVALTLDFANVALWNGSGWTTGQTVQNRNHVTNIGLKIGGNLGNAGEVQSGVAFDADVVSNILELNTQTLYVKTGQNVVTDMDVKHLLQRVNGCQAMLGYDSTYFPNPGGPVVAAGGGVWDLVIYDSWSLGSGTPGEIDTAIGVNAYGATGTDADGTVAKITLVAGTTEGTTRIVFRADHPTNDTKQTFLSDMSAQPVWPMKYDSQIIVIDGTAPTINIVSAKQAGQELIGSGINAVQGTVNIQVTASDSLAGLVGPPTVTVADSASGTISVSYVNESPAGKFNYTATIAAATANGTATIDASVSDKSGNPASATPQTFNVNKNQITGSVAMVTLSGASYSFSRTVDVNAMDGSGTVLKTWNVSVSFVNNPVSGVATGSYTLTDVPGTAASISAKTAWSLRRKCPTTLDGNGQAVTDFVGTAGLRGGDINASNTINILDYSTLRTNWMTGNSVADINGDGQVQTLDYSIMKSNWFATGDAP
jgi:hypothetical protein